MTRAEQVGWAMLPLWGALGAYHLALSGFAVTTLIGCIAFLFLVAKAERS